jgi:hypothetical protein
MRKNKDMKKSEDNKIILYQDDNGITNVSVRFAEEDLWITQKQLADIYVSSCQLSEFASARRHLLINR